MALLYLDSFDHYQSADILSKWTSNFVSSDISLTTGRCGGNCVQLDLSQTLLKGLAFGSTRGTLGFAFRIDSAGTFAGSDISFAYVGNVNDDHMFLRANGDGSIEALHTGLGGASYGQSAPGLISQDHWYFIEWQMLIHASAGAVIVRVNNAQVISATGVNTVAPSGDAVLRRFSFHCGADQTWKLDDLYVLDDTGPAPVNDFLGDVKVEYLRPRAAGSSQAWALVGGSSHWSAVDDNETPDGDTTYVEAVTPGLTDTNLYEPTGLPSGPIFGAQLSLLARKADIGPRVISPVMNGVTGSPHLNVSTDSYRYHHTPYALNPATGLAWTIAEVNAIEAGVTVAS